jgi:subtilase family serine protease
MFRALSIGFLILTQAPVLAAASTCAGPDLAVTSVSVQSVTKTRYLNKYRVVGTVTNVGSDVQSSNVLQFVDINQYGDRLDDRGVPPLAPGQSYTIAYVWKRSVDAGNRTTPLSFHLRGVAPQPVSLNDCSPANDRYDIHF